MADIIQQLLDLKEWSQDSARYERRLAFRGSMGTEAGTIPLEFDELSPQEQEYYRQGPFSTDEVFLGAKGGVSQLVQPGPGRQGYDGNKDFTRNPAGINQYTAEMKSLDEIKATIDKFPEWTQQDFLGRGTFNKKGIVLSRTELERAKESGIEPHVKGKRTIKGTGARNLKRRIITKARSSESMEVALAALRKSGLQFSHLALDELTSLQNTGYLPKDINIKSYHKFEKKVVDIAKQIKEAQDNKKFSIPERRNKIAELQKEDRALRKQFPEYAKTKARLVTRATSLDPSGIMIKEKLPDPKIAISQEPGTQLKGETPKSEKGKKIIKIKQRLSSQIKNMDGKTLAQYKKFYPKCFEQDVGGNALRCLTKQAEKNSELFTKNSVSIAKATEGTKTSAQMINFLRKAKTLARGTGWLLAGEAVFAPLLTMGPYAKGKTWKRSMSDALYGLNKKWSLGLAESEADEIRETAGQLGYDAWKMKQIDAEREATMEKLNNIEQSDTQYGRGQGSYNTFVLTDKLEKLTKEYDDLSQQFLSGEVDAEGNLIGNELFDTALNNLTAGTQQIEKFDKQRVGERQKRWQKVGRTLMDKPREKFIDFTLGPNWKENLPEQQSQFYKKRYPRNPRELGQHLSYDPDIPTFAEGGIASLLKKK